MKVEVFGHFLDERGRFKVREFEEGEGIDLIVHGSDEVDSFVVKVLLDFVEVVLGSGSDSCHSF